MARPCLSRVTQCVVPCRGTCWAGSIPGTGGAGPSAPWGLATGLASWRRLQEGSFQLLPGTKPALKGSAA